MRCHAVMRKRDAATSVCGPCRTSANELARLVFVALWITENCPHVIHNTPNDDEISTIVIRPCRGGVCWRTVDATAGTMVAVESGKAMWPFPVLQHGVFLFLPGGPIVGGNARKECIMAIQQAAVTVTGFVAGDPVAGGTDTFRVLSFRMGSTRSRFNAETGQWEDVGTAWLAIKAYRALAYNAQSSIRRGDRIIVVGTLNTEQWSTPQGEIRSKLILEATNIGHDLHFGTTQLCKAKRGGPSQQQTSVSEGGGADPYASSSGSSSQPVDVLASCAADLSEQSGAMPQDDGHPVMSVTPTPQSNSEEHDGAFPSSDREF